MKAKDFVAMNMRRDGTPATAERRARRDIEHRLQALCVRWFRAEYPELSGLLFAVPNGGRRDALTGAKLREEGVVAGVSDLVLLKGNGTYNALLVEMKTNTGRQSQSQRDWQAVVERYGECLYTVCRSVEGFIEAVRGYLGQ